MNATATTTTTGTVQEPQHMQALEYANRIRLARADIKRRVARGELSVTEVILDAPAEVSRMTIADLLTSQRRWGRTRCRKLLMSIPISETKTLGSMTERQRVMLAAALQDKAHGEDSFPPLRRDLALI